MVQREGPVGGVQLGQHVHQRRVHREPLSPACIPVFRAEEQPNLEWLPRVSTFVHQRDY